jgi:hypothetical protein
MTMDQLFMTLPRDLQWEVLVEFVGSHAVHGGKLMRKISYNNFYLLLTMMQPFRVITDNLQPGQVHYFYRKMIDEELHVFNVCTTTYSLSINEPPLPITPFVKHEYPSYPYTNKKRWIPLAR